MSSAAPSSEGSTVNLAGTTVSKKRPMKMIVVKYFEDTDKYAKIIPRPAFHILRRRLEEEAQSGKTIKTAPTKEDAEKMTVTYGKDLMGTITRDQAEWFSTYDPITSIMLYNEKENK